MDSSFTSDFELLGITIAEPFPIGIQHLRVQPGLNLLYGKNGSGKTKILEAARRALTGNFPTGRYPWDSLQKRMPLYSWSGIHLRYTPQLAQRNAIWNKHNLDYWWDELFKAKPWYSRDPLTTGEDIPKTYLDCFALHLSESEWSWLRDQGRLHLNPSSGNLSICDPSPETSPLRQHWQESQETWNSLGLDPFGTGARSSLLWEDEGYALNQWLIDGELPRLDPLPGVLGLDQPPSWVAYPVITTGLRVAWDPPTEGLIDLEVVRDGESTWGLVTEAIVDYLAEVERRSTMKTSLKEANQTPQEAKDRLEVLVNSKLRGIFENPPTITLQENTQRSQFSKESPITIAVRLDKHGPLINAAQLGDGHRRFLTRIISLELSKTFEFRSLIRQRILKQLGPTNQFLNQEEELAQGELPANKIYGPSILLIDEPERGLHARAERTLAQGLASVADRVIAATHSIRLLDAGLKYGCTHLIERRIDGSFRISENLPAMSEHSQSILEETLGLSPAEVVTLISVFLLVEGIHDQLVIEHLLAPELAHLGARIVPMQGTTAVQDLVTSRFLFTATSSPIIIVLDNGNQQSIEKLLNDLRSTDRRESQRSALMKALHSSDFNSPEMKSVLNLLQVAIGSERLERIHPFFFQKRDIINYIPLRHFSSQLETWDEIDKKFLQSQNRNAFRAGDGRLKKEWMLRHGISVDAAGITRALKSWSADSPDRPAEFLNLSEQIARIARYR